ncbi:ATP binding cassette subfamily D member Pmp70 [Tachypleus tridentatus]|uniref:ATP binding cassette subfamily D member Pmp70 n=1 Tax=Tachypleus tridentatus TaxID=6853 RepID=UPI003FD181BC
MAPVLSKFLQSRKTSALTASAVLVCWMWYLKIKRGRRKAQQVDEVAVVFEQKDAKKSRAHVDAEFFRQLRKILRIIVPGFFTSEFGFLILVASSLIGRTMCDIWMIQNGTIIERAIISKDRELFVRNLISFIYAMPFISLMNNVLKYGLSELKLRFRTKLSQHLYNQYMLGMTYYRMSNLDTRISNPDQLLTQDVEKFCSCLTALYSNISKPILDIIIYIHRLTVAVGGEAPMVMMLYLVFAGLLLTRLRRPMGKMTVTEQKLEGELRYVNSRIITNSEEIAFYQGNTREKTTLQHAFERLFDHVRDLLEFHFCMGVIDNIVAKYFATVVGYILISRPFFSSRTHGSNSPGERLEAYYKSGRMLVKLAEAIGRLVLAGREMTRLAGFTTRVSQLMKVLRDLNKGHYSRTMISGSSIQIENTSSNKPKLKGYHLIPGAGRIITQDNIIKFDRVPLVTPSGDVLVEELSFEVPSGVNVLVCGPNGCGKSSLFRILGELWPTFGGTLIKPAKDKLFYIPQRPYMTLGTFRDQIIYPHSIKDMQKKGITDEDLVLFLEKVHLTYILEREGGWDVSKDWMDILSGGEKQRVAMARLFYHKPQFAILDECTSAVSVDVEGSMYQYCRQMRRK